MTNGKTAAVVLAAGMGTRMKSALPKCAHPIGGQPMIAHVLDAAAPLAPDPLVVVVGPDMDALAAVVAPYPVRVQPRRQGTADALKAARADLMSCESGTVLVLYGDTPFIRSETLARMVAAREAGAAVVALGFRPADPKRYGRLIQGHDGSLEAIVEAQEATPAQLAVDLCNAGAMALDAARLPGLLERIGNANAKGEYYLTDIVALARADGLACAVVEAPEEELLGVDDRAALARAEQLWQERRRAEAMAAGVTLTDPATVWFSHDTALAADVTVDPNVVFGPGVRVAEGAEIRAFCHLEGVEVGPGAVVGPFARLRPGTRLGAGAHVGNFVEIKNAVLGEGAKANHLTYLGDAEVGARANVGAGTITCNYDGFAKHTTRIGAGAFIGSNAALVAPVSIGDGAIVGAGSTIVRDVKPDALAVARGAQIDLPGGGRRFRDGRQSAKAAKPDPAGG